MPSYFGTSWILKRVSFLCVDKLFNRFKHVQYMCVYWLLDMCVNLEWITLNIISYLNNISSGDNFIWIILICFLVTLFSHCTSLLKISQCILLKSVSLQSPCPGCNNDSVLVFSAMIMVLKWTWQWVQDIIVLNMPCHNYEDNGGSTVSRTNQQC